MTVAFSIPSSGDGGSTRVHHAQAAAGNAAITKEAVGVLRDSLTGSLDVKRVLLKAAAGAGKSFALQELVSNAVDHPSCQRVAVVAFTNKQIHPLAIALGNRLGKRKVCLFVSAKRWEEIPDEAHRCVEVATSTTSIPASCEVIVSTSHKLGAINELTRQISTFGPAHCGSSAFDVLFVDEAWQLPHYLFDKVAKAAPLTVGVGDVGQLPPLEVGDNPWRGDPGHNPYRAWPTDYVDDQETWARELPSVWRPAAGQLDLWRAFYPEWDTLNCVAAPGDRVLHADGLTGDALSIWTQVGTGVPTLLEVNGLPVAEAADIDLPLVGVIERLLEELLSSKFSLERREYDSAGTPTRRVTKARPGKSEGDPLVVVLATRNQAVDDAEDMVDRLRQKFGLSETELVASTVDSWQGQTNGITVAIHPLNGATDLNEFNSAFGRLAVTCTRATHGLLMLARPGLMQLLDEAPARPGTPFGEPGNRNLPRQTHQRILSTFAVGRITVRHNALR